MANEIGKTQKELDTQLKFALENATSIITKDYLEYLEKYEVLSPSREDRGIDVAKYGKFFRLRKLVINKEENFLDKLTTILNVVSALESSFATVIQSDGIHIDYYFGVISKKARMSHERDTKRREADGKAFGGALTGNLQGSEWEEVSEMQVSELRETIFGGETNCYSAISGIVDLRNGEEKSVGGYVQGIENLVDSLKGIRYTVLMLADPVSSGEIQMMKQGYELLYTQLATFLHSSVTLNENNTQSLSKATTEGVTEGLSKGIAMTQSSTKSHGSFRSVNASVGVALGIRAGAGVGGGSNNGTSQTSGRTDSIIETNQKNISETRGASTTKGTGKSLQLNYENRSVKSIAGKD